MYKHQEYWSIVFLWHPYLVSVSVYGWFYTKSLGVFLIPQYFGRICELLVLILFKYLIELFAEAIWSGLPLLEVFWLLIQSLVIGLFKFSLSLWVSLSRLYVSITYLLLLESATCEPIIFKAFSYDSMYFCSVSCSASSFTYDFETSLFFLV